MQRSYPPSRWGAQHAPQSPGSSLLPSFPGRATKTQGDLKPAVGGAGECWLGGMGRPGCDNPTRA